MINHKLIFVLLLPLLSLTSCISYDNLVSYRAGEGLPLNQPVRIKNTKTLFIQSNDVLEIKIHSQDVLTATPFNLTPQGGNGIVGNAELYQLNGYLVDKDGFIDFPVLGKLEVKGMTIREAKMYLLGRLEEYLKEPVVNVRFLNFRITVSGEVTRPGSFIFYNERVTLPEVITMAGDFTSYANRKNVLLVREVNGERTFANVDMSSSDFFKSDYYYLQQNDLIYIEPLEAKRGAVRDNSNKILPFVSAFVSIAALIISSIR